MQNFASGRRRPTGVSGFALPDVASPRLLPGFEPAGETLVSLMDAPRTCDLVLSPPESRTRMKKSTDRRSRYLCRESTPGKGEIGGRRSSWSKRGLFRPRQFLRQAGGNTRKRTFMTDSRRRSCCRQLIYLRFLQPQAALWDRPETLERAGAARRAKPPGRFSHPAGFSATSRKRPSCASPGASRSRRSLADFRVSRNAPSAVSGGASRIPRGRRRRASFSGRCAPPWRRDARSGKSDACAKIPFRLERIRAKPRARPTSSPHSPRSRAIPSRNSADRIRPPKAAPARRICSGR